MLSQASVPLTIRVCTNTDRESDVEPTYDHVSMSLSPLSDKDIDEVTTWLRAQYINAARASLPEGLDEAARRELLGIALDKSMGLSFYTDAGNIQLASPDGLAKLLHVMSKEGDRYPATYDELKSAMHDESNQEAFNTAFELLEASKSQGVVGGRKEKRKRPTKKNRKR